jgi:type I restriction enzyme, S subunit
LDKADRVRRKRQEAIQLTEELGRSIFLDMFGDPVTNPKGWEIKKLKSVIQSIDAGWSANGEEKKCEEDEWGVLKVSAVTSGKFKPFEHKSVGRSPNFAKPPIVPKKGDLLFSRANTRELVAATCIVDRDYERIFLSDKLWRISVSKHLATPEYLKFLLTYQRYRDLLTKQATGTSGSMLNISQGKLLNMDAPIPDIDTQKRFSDLIWKSVNVLMKAQENNKESENLFNSLLQRAFRGEL